MLGTLGASLLQYHYQVNERIEQVKALLEQVSILMPPHPFTNFEIQKYYPKEPKFINIYSRNNLPKI